MRLGLGALLPHWAGHCVSGCVNVCFCSVGNADVAAVSVGSNKGIFRCFFFSNFFFFTVNSIFDLYIIIVIMLLNRILNVPDRSCDFNCR